MINEGKFDLIVIDVTGEHPLGLGTKIFETHPRIGEWIEIDVESQGTMFEVVKVAHSSTGRGSDLYVRLAGPTYKVVGGLCSQDEPR